ncbi:hypothetical protein Angca_005425, partial [Angiostrongylus cantonensis]
PVTDEERAALMKKLDDDLELFMEEMPAKKVSVFKNVERKPFDFNEWCSDIEQHPAFMKDLETGLGGKYAETISALQAMKYDDVGEDKQINAERHRQEGNKHFKLKKYRWATDCYTEGIKQKCLDRKLNSILYSNRAAAEKYIGNLRCAIKDSAMALRFNPMNLKAAKRGAECLLELGHANDCVDWIELAVRNFASGKEIYEEGRLDDIERSQIVSLESIKGKAMEIALTVKRNERKARFEEKKDIEDKSRLLKALAERRLNLRPRLPFTRPELMDWSLLEVNLPQAPEHYRVSFNDDGNLQWPFLIQYPQVGQVDVLTDCDETSQVGSVLRPMLETPAEWDINHMFRIDNIRMFVSDEWNEFVMEVWEWSTFGSVLSLPGFQIVQGLPVIMVFTRSEVEEKFNVVGENKFVVD